MMSILATSLKRLYENKKVTKTKLKAMVEDGKISSDEFEYITGTNYSKQEYHENYNKFVPAILQSIERDYARLWQDDITIEFIVEVRKK